MHHKFIGIILTISLTITLLFGGCQQTIIGENQVVFNPNETITTTETQQEDRVKTIKLPCSYNEPRTPWATPDEDTRISGSLLFDSLVRLTPDYQVEYTLAKSITTTDNIKFIIEINPAIQFSDGSPLTVENVIASFSAAVAQGSDYQSSFTHFSSQKKIDDTHLEITLSRADALFPNLLTFPIAKPTPEGYIGTGRYVYRSRSAEKFQLERNPNYWGETSSIPMIELVDLPEQEISSYSIKVGNVDCMYTDLSTTDAMNLSSSNYPVDLNQIVFLGVNCLNGRMSDMKIRQAIHAALNREYLAESVYSSRAKAAYTPFNPNFHKVADVAAGQQDLASAQSLLDEVGITQENPLTLRLIYNSANSYRTQMASQIAAQLSEIGIQVELVGKNYNDYIAALNSSSYDLYIGELKIPDNMDLTHLLTRGQNYGFGVASFEELNQAYAAAIAGTGTYETAVAAFQKYLPTIPLLYRQGMFAFSRGLSLNVIATRQDIFYNIDQWQ